MTELWDLIEEVHFDDHFKKENLEFRTLLADENVIAEFKNQNAQLFQFIRKHDFVFKEMIEYITIMPSEEDTDERKFKLPFVSGEILAIQNVLVYEAFFGRVDESDPEDEIAKITKTNSAINLKSLLDYFKQVDLNPLLLGYIEKVLNNLFYGRRTELLREIFDHYISCLTKNLGNMNIANILRKILTLEKEKEGNYTQERFNVIKVILDQYANESEDFHENFAGILIELTTKYLVISDGKEMIEYVLAHISQMLSNTKIDKHVLRFLKAIIIKVSAKVQEGEEDTKILVPQNFFITIAKYLVQLDLSQSSPNTIMNQQKQSVALLGVSRINVIDLIKEICKLAQHDILQLFCQYNIYEKLLTLVVQYPYNNILHSAYQIVIIQSFKDSIVRQYLVNSHNLIAKIKELFTETKKSYYAQLVNIVLALVKYEDAYIVPLFKEEGQYVTFYEDYILPRKEKNEFKWATVGSSKVAIQNKPAPEKFQDEEFIIPAHKEQESKEDPFGNFSFGFTSKPSTAPITNNFNPFATFQISQPEQSKQSEQSQQKQLFNAFDFL